MKNCEKLISAGNIPDAYALLASVYINLGGVGLCRDRPSFARQRVKEIIDEALVRYPGLASAYAIKGLLALVRDHDWLTAKAHMQESIRLNSNNKYGHHFLAHVLVASGEDFEKGLEHARLAATLDYGRALTVATEPWLMLFAGRVPKAVARAEEVVQLFEDSSHAHVVLGHAYLESGKMDMAIAQYKTAVKIDQLPDAYAALGYAQAKMGDRANALDALNALAKLKKDKEIAYVSPYQHALVQAGLNEPHIALDLLEQAYEERCDWLVHIGVEPRWKSLHNEKRFTDLMRRVNLHASSLPVRRHRQLSPR
jgi:tetratricopeptide (TPR) repeat protein